MHSRLSNESHLEHRIRAICANVSGNIDDSELARILEVSRAKEAEELLRRQESAPFTYTLTTAQVNVVAAFAEEHAEAFRIAQAQENAAEQERLLRLVTARVAAVVEPTVPEPTVAPQSVRSSVPIAQLIKENEER